MDYFRFDLKVKFFCSNFFIIIAIFSFSSVFAAESISNYSFVNRADMDQFQGFGYAVESGQPKLSHNATLSTSVYYINDDDSTYYIVIPKAYYSANLALFVTSTTEMPAVGVNCTIPTQILGNSTLGQSWNGNAINGYYVFNYNKLNSIFSGGMYLCLTTRNSESTTFNKNIYVVKLKNMSINEASSSIIGELQNQTNTIDNSISSATSEITSATANATNQVTDTLTNSTVSDDTYEVSTSDYNVDEKSQETDSFFTTLLNNVYDFFSSLSDDVITLKIPLPNGSTLSIPSDIISRYIIGTWIYTTIQIFWYYFFGTYLIIFSKRLIEWLSTGKIVEQGIFSFSEWLIFTTKLLSLI